MKLFACIFTLVSALTFHSTANSAMTVSSHFESINSAAFMDMVIEKSGSLKGVGSEFLKVTVKGETELDNCSIKKDFISYGDVSANETEFCKDCCVYSGEILLSTCSLPALYIFDGNDPDVTVYLEGATVINGPIVFETGEGKVYKTSDVIINGEIIGGTLVDSEA